MSKIVDGLETFKQNYCDNNCNGISKRAQLKDEDATIRRLQEIEEARHYLLERTDHRPKFAIICGTGLGSLSEVIEDQCHFPYEAIPHCVVSTVKGHAGRLVFGKLGGISVVCMQGRIHAFEGHPLWKTTFLVRVFRAIGVLVLVATNAAGGLNQELRRGDVVVIKDHINLPGLVGFNPLIGLNDDRFGVRFPALSDAYDREFRRVLLETAQQLKMDFVKEGVYCFQTGPCYETVIESRLMRSLGADVAGMSTVPEVLVGVHCNLRIVCLSVVTNMCVVDYEADVRARHDDIIVTGQSRAADLASLIATSLPKLAASIEPTNALCDSDGHLKRNPPPDLTALSGVARVSE